MTQFLLARNVEAGAAIGDQLAERRAVADETVAAATRLLARHSTAAKAQAFGIAFLQQCEIEAMSEKVASWSAPSAA